jgi:hypothetical protein
VIAVAVELAQAIIRDGEGASKFITVAVEGGRDREECKRVGYAVAHSPLVKTAFFASDPNLGRILAAIGYADIDALDPSTASASGWQRGNEILVAEKGGRAASYREEDGAHHAARRRSTSASTWAAAGARRGLYLRPLLRLREDQRRLPQLAAPQANQPEPAGGQQRRSLSVKSCGLCLRLAGHRQCRTCGTASVKTGISAELSPVDGRQLVTAAHRADRRIRVDNRWYILNFSPGCSSGCRPTTPRPRTSCTSPAASVMIQ